MKSSKNSRPGASRERPGIPRIHPGVTWSHFLSPERLWDLKIKTPYRDPEKIQTPYRDPDRTDHAHRVIEPKKSKPHTEIPKNDASSHSDSNSKTVDPPARPRQPAAEPAHRSKPIPFPPQSSRAGLQEVARWQSQTPSNYCCCCCCCYYYYCYCYYQ